MAIERNFPAKAFRDKVASSKTMYHFKQKDFAHHSKYNISVPERPGKVE